jgi:hypothetical protein
MPRPVPVACPAGRGYAARVSRLHFHRWVVIFLLVSKLILGEFTHAMPQMAHEMGSPATMNEVVTPASASHDSPPCGNHVQAGTELGQPQDASSGDHAAKNCCKGGECACPCLHSPAASAAVPFVMHLTHDNQASMLVQGAIWYRQSGLFRPPA